MAIHMIVKNIEEHELKPVLRELRNEYKTKVIQAKSDYFSQRIESSNNKCKTAWSIIRQIAQPDENITNISIWASEFNSFFIDSVKGTKENIGTAKVNTLELLKNHRIESNVFNWREVTSEEVLEW